MFSSKIYSELEKQNGIASARQPVGFTMIELLTVIALIGILAGMILGLSGLASSKMRIARVQGELSHLVTAIEFYKDKYKVYPPDNQLKYPNGNRIPGSSATNQLVLELASDYRSASALEIRIADLEDKISALQTGNTTKDIAEAKEELRRAIDACSAAYRQVYAHMQEIVERPFYTTYLEFSSAQGEAEGFLGTNVKKMMVGAVAGAFIACGLWFVSAFAAELKRSSRRTVGRKEVD